jgi:hypothetical protein
VYVWQRVKVSRPGKLWERKGLALPFGLIRRSVAGTGMSLVDLLELLEGGVGITYGRGDRVVTEELTQEHKVAPRVKHIGGKGVTKGMRSTTGEVGHRGEGSVYDLVDGLRAHRSTPRGDEQCLGRAKPLITYIPPVLDGLG